MTNALTALARFFLYVVVAVLAAASIAWFGLRHLDSDHDVYLLGMGAAGVVLFWAGVKLSSKIVSPLFRI